MDTYDYYYDLERELIEETRKPLLDQMLNPIGIKYHIFYPDPDNNGKLVLKEFVLSKDGTFVDFAADIEHDSHGDRTPPMWDPLDNLKTVCGRPDFIEDTETIALNKCISGIITRDKILYYQFIKYPVNMRDSVLKDIQAGTNAGIEGQLIREGKENNIDAMRPDFISEDHGVSVLAVITGTGTNASLTTMGHLYDTVSGLKSFNSDEFYPSQPDKFNKVGCAITISLEGYKFFFYVRGNVDNANNVTYSGKINYNGNEYPFLGSQLDANIPSVGKGEFYNGGDIVSLPQFIKATFKYMGDRAHIPSIYYSAYIDDGTKILAGATHDKIAYSAMSNIEEKYNGNSNNVVIPCVFTRSNLKSKLKNSESYFPINSNSVPMIESSDDDTTNIPVGLSLGDAQPANKRTFYESKNNKFVTEQYESGVFLYVIPRILNSEQIEEQRSKLEKKEKISSLENERLFLLQISMNLKNIIDNINTTLVARKTRATIPALLNIIKIFENDLNYYTYGMNHSGSVDPGIFETIQNIIEGLQELSRDFETPGLKEELLTEGIHFLNEIRDVYIDAKIKSLSDEIDKIDNIDSPRRFLTAKRGGKPKNRKTKKHNKKTKTHKKNKKISKNKNKKIIKIIKNNKKTRKNKD